MSYVGKAMNYKHHITFKGLQETVEKLNTTLEKQPIPGKILGFSKNMSVRQITDI